MFTYTCNDTTYYVAGSKVYVTMDETHSLEEIDDHAIHLYEYDNEKTQLARLEWGGTVFNQVKIIPVDESGPSKQYVHVDDFEPVTPVRSLVPDEINECPECGSWAGAREQSITCLHCGYGTQHA